MLHVLPMAASPSLTQVFFSELVGTATLLLLGVGVVANAILPKAKGGDANFHLVAWGWGIAVFAGVYLAWRSGGHINPAVTLGLTVNGVEEYAPGVPVSVLTFALYLAAQFIGAFLGAVLAWLAYYDQFNATAPAEDKLGVFTTGAEVRNPVRNIITEAIATFVLVVVVLAFGETPSGLGPFAVALLVVGIGVSLGGPTGYAINPARDWGPRLAHTVLPIRGKGGSDWGYAWVTLAGPMVGATLAGLFARVYI